LRGNFHICGDGSSLRAEISKGTSNTSKELHNILEASEERKEVPWLKRNFLLIMRNFYSHFWNSPCKIWKSQAQKKGSSLVEEVDPLELTPP